MRTATARGSRTILGRQRLRGAPGSVGEPLSAGSVEEVQRGHVGYEVELLAARVAAESLPADDDRNADDIDVYLPAGDWADAWTGVVPRGPATITRTQ